MKGDDEMPNIITDALLALLKRNGWQVSPNNIHGLPGVELTPAGPGALQPANFNESIRWVGTGFVVLRREARPRPGTTFVDYTHDVLLVTTSEEHLLAWLEANGKRSEGGQPAGSCGVWD